MLSFRPCLLSILFLNLAFLQSAWAAPNHSYETSQGGVGLESFGLAIAVEQFFLVDAHGVRGSGWGPFKGNGPQGEHVGAWAIHHFLDVRRSVHLSHCYGRNYGVGESLSNLVFFAQGVSTLDPDTLERALDSWLRCVSSQEFALDGLPDILRSLVKAEDANVLSTLLSHVLRLLYGAGIVNEWVTSLQALLDGFEHSNRAATDAEIMAVQQALTSIISSIDAFILEAEQRLEEHGEGPMMPSMHPLDDDALFKPSTNVLMGERLDAAQGITAFQNQSDRMVRVLQHGQSLKVYLTAFQEMLRKEHLDALCADDEI